MGFAKERYIDTKKVRTKFSGTEALAIPSLVVSFQQVSAIAFTLLAVLPGTLVLVHPRSSASANMIGLPKTFLSLEETS